MKNDRLILRWNLPRVAADLAAQLESLGELGDSTWEDCEEYLEPYNLSPDDFDTVVGHAWKVGCIDCGRLWDHYMVYSYIWRDAGLEPHQYCCRKCLSVRLGRPLEQMDFTPCPLNSEAGVLPEPIDTVLQADIDKAFDRAPEGMKEAFEEGMRRLRFSLHLPAGLCDLRVQEGRCRCGRCPGLPGAWRELIWKQTKNPSYTRFPRRR
jgi:hypothetical protein